MNDNNNEYCVQGEEDERRTVWKGRDIIILAKTVERSNKDIKGKYIDLVQNGFDRFISVKFGMGKAGFSAEMRYVLPFDSNS